jgi:hypothetical protein
VYKEWFERRDANNCKPETWLRLTSLSCEEASLILFLRSLCVKDFVEEYGLCDGTCGAAHGNTL